jgi:hypothetical protein
MVHGQLARRHFSAAIITLAFSALPLPPLSLSEVPGFLLFFPDLLPGYCRDKIIHTFQLKLSYVKSAIKGNRGKSTEVQKRRISKVEAFHDTPRFKKKPFRLSTAGNGSINSPAIQDHPLAGGSASVVNTDSIQPNPPFGSCTYTHPSALP